MAHSKEKWLEAEGFFKSGLTLREIENRTGIDYRTVQKESKKRQWRQGENVEYIEAKIKVNQKREELGETKEGQIMLYCADEIANDLTKRRNLVNGSLIGIMNRIRDILNTGTIQEKVSTGNGVQVFQERKIGAKDLKDLVDAVNTAGIALKVIDKKEESKSDNLMSAFFERLTKGNQKPIKDVEEQ